jgi:hypothetical protein
MLNYTIVQVLRQWLKIHALLVFLTFELSRLQQRDAPRGQGRMSEASLARVGQPAVAGRLE